MVCVQQLDPEDAPRRYGLHQGGVLGIVTVADRRLPEADVSTRHVQVARLRTELVGLGVRMILAQVRGAPGATLGSRRRPEPALRTDIARYTLPSEIWHMCAGPLEQRPVLVAPHDLLLDVLEPGRHEQRPDPDLHRVLGECGPQRFEERTAANVATASTSVPPAVASDAIVVQSAIATEPTGSDATH